MLRDLLYRIVPASLYGRKTAYPLVSALRRELAGCTGAGEALQAVERAKPELYARLSRRFPKPAAQALTLKVLNVLLAQYDLAARTAAVSARPAGLIVDPSNTCRLGCPGCVHSARQEELRTFDWRNGTLSERRFAALLRRFGPCAVGVYFCDYGEPLLNLRTPALIRAAKRYLLATALSTSLSVKKFDAEAYVESGLDFMVVSVDGVTQGVYETFRRNGDLALVLENMRKLVEAKRKLGRRTPAISWNFLAFEHNVHQITEAARLARSLGVNQFRVVEPFDVSWDDPAIRPASVRGGVRRLDWSTLRTQAGWNPLPESELEADGIATAYESPWTAALSEAARRSPGHACHWLYKNLVMDANGRVLPCCGAPEAGRDLVFTIFEEGAGDPFNSAKHQAARAHFTGAAQTSSHCARCEWDQTNVSIGGPEIARYFRSADPFFFDRRSRRLLAKA